MALPNHKTKIVCTIGPASESPAVLSQMIEAGMIAAVRKKYGQNCEVDVEIDGMTGAINIGVGRQVVEEVEDPTEEVSLAGHSDDASCHPSICGGSSGKRLACMRPANSSSLRRVQTARTARAVADVSEATFEAEVVGAPPAEHNRVVQRITIQTALCLIGPFLSCLAPTLSLPRFHAWPAGPRIIQCDAPALEMRCT